MAESLAAPSGIASIFVMSIPLWQEHKTEIPRKNRMTAFAVCFRRVLDGCFMGD